MKATVILENGRADIILLPENQFEKDLIEKVEDSESVETLTSFNVVSNYGDRNDHNIKISVTGLK